MEYMCHHHVEVSSLHALNDVSSLMRQNDHCHYSVIETHHTFVFFNAAKLKKHNKSDKSDKTNTN